MCDSHRSHGYPLRTVFQNDRHRIAKRARIGTQQLFIVKLRLRGSLERDMRVMDGGWYAHEPCKKPQYGAARGSAFPSITQQFVDLLSMPALRRETAPLVLCGQVALGWAPSPREATIISMARLPTVSAEETWYKQKLMRNLARAMNDPP